ASIPDERLVWIAADMEALLASAAAEDDLDRYYLRIKSAWKLSREDQFLVSRLAVWRERLAREEDRPRGRIVPDAVLVDAVRLRARSRNQLSAIEGFHPRSVRQYGDLLLAMIDDLGGRPVPGDFVMVQPPLERDARKVLSGLRGLIEAKAKALDLVPEVLARKRDLEALVRSALDGRPALPPALARGWRHTVIGQELLAYVS
ncbi:MAG: HRDC domain-containing protein, partial [Porticoccaceae bacterium]